MYNVTPVGLVLKMVIGGNKNLFIKNDKNFDLKVTKAKKFNLNQEQNNALKFLDLKNDRFDVSVLQGTTGSGKTLVYFERIKKIISENKQALVLLPEIFLTNEFKSRFYDFFGFEPAIWHSKITPKNKRIIWNGVINNNIKLVIGARSSLLLPFKKLGVIVVDEEHDTSYKQDEGVIYHARDMAIARASFEKIPIHLISAIPSLETFNNIQNKKFRHFKINKRYADYPLPKTKIVNLNLKKIKNSCVSDESIEIVKKFLEKGEQVLFFLNRRGYAPSMICKVCGWISNCERCDALMTVHKNPFKLQCHHCEAQKPYPNKCQSCGSNDFLTYGFGTERIEEFLHNHFPEATTLRIDSDSTRRKDTLNEYFSEIRKGKPMILLGTQLLAKGHHFPDVTLVGIIDADSGLFSADFRGSERVAQLMTQVSGRAGRDKKPGRVILQSYCPDHPQIEEIVTGSYDRFAKKLLEERKSSKIPPFSFQAKIFAESPKGLGSRDFILKILNRTKVEEKVRRNIRIVGPLPAIIEKKSGVYRWELSVFSESRSGLHKFLDIMQSRLYDPKVSKQVRWSIDVDPLSSI